MIGRLQGTPCLWQPPLLILDVQGVGYELQTPASISVAMGRPLVLYTHLLVRDDQLQLYGFESLQQRDVFRSLLRISGIGARMGLALLSTWRIDELWAIIREEDLKALTRVPGIGRKTGEKLLVELKHRFRHHLEAHDSDIAAPRDDRGGVLVRDAAGGSALQLAQQALEQLGYRAAEAQRLIDSVPEAKTMDTAELVKAALKQAHRG